MTSKDKLTENLQFELKNLERALKMEDSTPVRKHIERIKERIEKLAVDKPLT